MASDVTASFIRYPHFESILNKSIELTDGAILEIEDADRDLTHGPSGAATFEESLRFDVSVIPIVRYIAGREHGFQWTAIPVFPARRFVQWMVEVPEESGIHDAKGLEGKRIAQRYHGYTDAVWTKGVLEESYNVDLSSVSWFTLRGELVPGTVAPGDVVCREGADPNELLVSGEIDAVFLEGYGGPTSPGVRRLWADPEGEAAAWYRASRCFPILNVVVVRDSTMAAHACLAGDLYRILDGAKSEALVKWDYGASLPESERTAALQSGFPTWASGAAARRFLGEDPIPYGLAVEANVDALERVIRYASLQKATQRVYSLEELLAATDS